MRFESPPVDPESPFYKRVRDTFPDLFNKWRRTKSRRMDEWDEGGLSLRDEDYEYYWALKFMLTEAHLPFLYKGPCPPPPVAAVFLSLLTVRYIFEGDIQPLDVRSILRLIEPEPYRWPQMGGALVVYCQNSGSLLRFAEVHHGTPMSGLDQTVQLSERGCEVLLSLRPAGEPVSERRHGDLSARIRGILGKGCVSRKRREEPEDNRVIDLQTPRTTLKDLVLPGDMMLELQLLAKLCKKSRFSGSVTLLMGPPGVGKSHAAMCFAGEIRRKLAVVPLSRINNRYVGETEKQIEFAFKEAAEARAVLLFDEVDALLLSRDFALRSWEFSAINTLLKCLENPKVPCFLATNYGSRLDDALMRRVTNLLTLTMPILSERRAIWEREMKANKLTAKVDFERLASLELSGGLIQKAVLQARNKKRLLGRKYQLTTEALLACGKRELRKMGTSTHRPIGFTSSFSEKERVFR